MVFAYGDGQFAFSMQGCHGGTPHARLRRLLALKRRVVLVDEYLTTKRCPNCRCQTHLSKEERRDPSLYRSTFMVQPRGVAQYTRRDGAVVRKRVHGLSQCYRCSTLWSRDYAATLNIGRVFVEQWQAGVRPAYLCRPSTMCVAASEDGSLRSRVSRRGCCGRAM